MAGVPRRHIDGGVVVADTATLRDHLLRVDGEVLIMDVGSSRARNHVDLMDFAPESSLVTHGIAPDRVAVACRTSSPKRYRRATLHCSGDRHSDVEREKGLEALWLDTQLKTVLVAL